LRSHFSKNPVKVISLPAPRRRAADTEALQRVQGARAEAQILPLRRGVPRTVREWTALVKVASGEIDIPSTYYVRLVALGLIERTAGLPTLTRHGRVTLGLPE
jgi:hypothetical protein